MALVLMIIGAMATATTIGWTLATLVKVDFPVSRQTIYDIACNKDLPGCSGCSEVRIHALPELLCSCKVFLPGTTN